MLKSQRSDIVPTAIPKAVHPDVEMQNMNDDSSQSSHSTTPALERNGDEEGDADGEEEVEEGESSKPKRSRQTLKLETMIFQSDKKKRDTYYYNRSRYLKKNFEKLGIYTGCFGILYLHRYISVSCKASLTVCRRVEDNGAESRPVVFTTAIHNDEKLYAKAADNIREIAMMVEAMKEAHMSS